MAGAGRRARTARRDRRGRGGFGPTPDADELQAEVKRDLQEVRALHSTRRSDDMAGLRDRSRELGGQAQADELGEQIRG